MDIKRCYEILELDQNASPEDLKQAYKDIVNVWHPDRFVHHPRLKKKAEKRLKEINTAYETLRLALSPDVDDNRASRQGPGLGTRVERTRGAGQRQDKTEAFFETGTGVILGLWASLTTAFHRIVHEAKSEIERNDTKGEE